MMIDAEALVVAVHQTRANENRNCSADTVRPERKMRAAISSSWRRTRSAMLSEESVLAVRFDRTAAIAIGKA